MLPCAVNRASKHHQASFAAASYSIARSAHLLFLYPQWFQQLVQQRQHRSLHQPRERKVSGRIGCGSLLSYKRQTKLAAQSSSCISSSRSIHDSTAAKSSPRAGVSTSHSRRKPRPHVASCQKALSHREKLLNARPRLISRRSDLSLTTERFVPKSLPGLRWAKRLREIDAKHHSTHDDFFKVDIDFLEWLTGTRKGTSWIHYGGTGCTIESLEEDDLDDTRRKLRLRGSLRSRRITHQWLHEANLDFKAAQRNKAQPHVNEATLNRSESETYEALQRTRVDNISPPDTWTVRSFYSYVQDITASKPTRGRQQHMYSRSELADGHGHDGTVAHMLEILFNAPDLRHFLSTAALRSALRFTTARTQLSESTGKVWYGFTKAGLIPDIHCFNFDIQRALTVNNIDRIDWLLNEMQLSKVRPNGKTWAMILPLVETSFARREIQKHLLELPHLNTPEERQGLAIAFVKNVFGLHIRGANPFKHFVYWMDSTLGQHWPSEAAAEAMLYQCCKSKMFSMVPAIIAFAKSHNFDRSQRLRKTIAMVIAEVGDFDKLSTLMKLFWSDKILPIDQLLITSIFKLAWDQNRPSACRAIWHYAATHGCISYATQMLVAENLGSNVHANGADDSQKIAGVKAAMVVGTDLTFNDLSSKYPLLTTNKSSASPVKLLLSWTSNTDGSRHQQMQLIHTILDRDLLAWRNFAPMTNSRLFDYLEKARDLDTIWFKACETGETVEALVEHAIPINLDPRPTDALDGARSRTTSIDTNQGSKDFEESNHASSRSNSSGIPLDKTDDSIWEQCQANADDQALPDKNFMHFEPMCNTRINSDLELVETDSFETRRSVRRSPSPS